MEMNQYRLTLTVSEVAMDSGVPDQERKWEIPVKRFLKAPCLRLRIRAAER